MSTIYTTTEADEAATTAAAALENLAHQVRTGETAGVIGMYAAAAQRAGASADDIRAVLDTTPQ